MRTVERIWVIINPASGKSWGKKLQGGNPEQYFWDIVKGSQRSAEWLASLRIVFTQPTGPNTVANLARQAVEAGATRIVAGGGDGTFNQTIQVPGIVRRIPLAIVPFGSANNLADNLGIPKDPRQAIALALSERVAVRKIDLGRVNDRYWFANVASLGLDAKIIEKGTDLRTKSSRLRFVRNVSWGKVYCWLAGVGLVLGLHPRQCSEVDLRLDDWPLKTRIALINIGNGPRCGGAFKLNPNAKMDDGMLDMCLIESMGALRAVQYAWRALSGSHINLPGVISCKVERLTVRCDQELSAEVDGEPLEPGHRFNIAVWREALSVIVPPFPMTLATVPVSDQKVRLALSQSFSPEPA